MKSELIKSEVTHKGKIFTTHATVWSRGDEKVIRDIVYCDNSAAILPITSEDEFVFVRQYREAAEKYVLEIPAGRMGRGENSLEAAVRELSEETGYKITSTKKIGEFYASPGTTTEKISVFLGFNAKKTSDQSLDGDEMIDIVVLDRKKVLDMLENGEFEDAKTIIALQYCFLPY